MCPLYTIDPRDEANWSMVPLDADHPERTVQIGSSLSPLLKQELIKFLLQCKNVFSRSHEDMPSIDPDFLRHELNMMCIAKYTDSTLKGKHLKLLIEGLHVLGLIKLKRKKNHRILTNVKSNIFDDWIYIF